MTALSCRHRASQPGSRAGPADALYHRLPLYSVRDLPWWGVASSAAAPVLMVAGWTAAARLQPHPVDPVAETVSALAAVGATDRWVMTLTFVLVGACDLITGLALRPARTPGRRGWCSG